MQANSKLTSQIQTYLNELEKFDTLKNDSSLQSSISLDNTPDNKELSSLTSIAINILEKMYEQLRHLNSRSSLIQKYVKNKHSREAIIPKEELLKKEIYEKNNLHNELKKWSEKYVFAYMFIDKPNEAIQLAYMYKFTLLHATFGDIKKMEKLNGDGHIKKMLTAKIGFNYLLEHAEGFGITPKMIIDSASLKIFLLFLHFSDAKPYRLKDIVEGIFNNLGYKVELKLDRQAAQKALPIAFYRESVIFGYPSRQKDNISTQIYDMFSGMLDYTHNEIIKRIEIEENEENRQALLKSLDRISNNHSNMLIYMMIS